MSLIKKVDIPDNKRTYEKTLPFIDSILWNLWFQISENTKKDLMALFSIIGFLIMMILDAVRQKTMSWKRKF